jgi:hypothetical protein
VKKTVRKEHPNNTGIRVAKICVNVTPIRTIDAFIEFLSDIMTAKKLAIGRLNARYGAYVRKREGN